MPVCLCRARPNRASGHGNPNRAHSRLLSEVGHSRLLGHCQLPADSDLDVARSDPTSIALQAQDCIVTNVTIVTT
jgi:hypothetical protein